jgi:hypothetical protein
MTSRSEGNQIYGGRKPKNFLPAHNHVIHTPQFWHGVNGFRRFWIPPQWLRRGWKQCPCGWRGHDPKWQVHYARSPHVEWWKEQIKKRGSLDAVYMHIIRRLKRSDDIRRLKHERMKAKSNQQKNVAKLRIGRQ